jgi:glucokinase
MSEKSGMYIGVDLGGTNIEAAAVRGGKVLAANKVNTLAEQGAEKVIRRIVSAVREVMAELDGKANDFKGLCIGAPGAVDHETGLVWSAPNLNWENVPLGQLLQEQLGIPVFVDNDVNIGVVGEYSYGAGQGVRNMVGIFVGTGIGGGLILNGKFHYGGRGAAGEIGHMVIVPQGRTCGCGKQGCVEAYASKTAMKKALMKRTAQGQASIVPELWQERKDQKLSSGVIADALARHDQAMIEVCQEAQFYLGLLTANLVNVLDPEVIVYGGGIVEELGEPFIEPIRETARKYFLQQKDADRIRILTSTLGDDAGPIGAAVIAQQHLTPASEKKV